MSDALLLGELAVEVGVELGERLLAVGVIVVVIVVFGHGSVVVCGRAGTAGWRSTGSGPLHRPAHRAGR